MSAGNPGQKIYVYAVFSSLKILRGEGVCQHRAFPLHKHLRTIAFGFTKAQEWIA